MRILLAADGSPYTRRILDFLAAYDEWFDPSHEYIVFHGTAALPRGAQQLVEPERLRDAGELEAETVFRPIRRL